MRKSRLTAGIFVFLLVLSTAFAVASSAAEFEEDEAPAIPAYAVARLKVNAGDAWVKFPDSDWEQATNNTPLKSGARVSVPEGSEAEIQFHGGQFVLLTPETDVEIPEMSEGQTRFRLRAGEVRFDLPGDDFAPVVVRVPGGARAQFAEPGRYWLNVTDEDTTVLVVRRGRATVSQEGEKHRLEEGQQATIGHTISVARYHGASDPVTTPAPLTEEERQAGVPPVVSYELRSYGDWVYTPSYGYVWRPRVATDWTPYVYGRWEWMSPYGWTWVSYEPWGWYPYRAGYWVSAPGFGWVWTPYGSFVTVGVGWGWGWGWGYDYYHHNPYHYHRNFHYRPSNARFIPESGGRGVRWAPLRPGERYRRPDIRRDDDRLRTWNRPLDRGKVYVAHRPEPGARIWRDVREVRAERQRTISSVSERSPNVRRDTRPVRPELSRQAPAGTRSVERPNATATTPRTDRGSDRAAPAERVERRSTGEAPRVTPRTPSAPPRATAPRETTAPVPPVSPSRDVPSARERATIPPVSPPRDVPSAAERATIPPVSPPRGTPAPPSRDIERPSAPVREAPSRGGDIDRGGGGFDRGGGGFDRGGGGFDRGGGGGGGRAR